MTHPDQPPKAVPPVPGATSNAASATSAASATATTSTGSGSSLSFWAQFIVSVGLAVGVLWYLVQAPESVSHHDTDAATPLARVVEPIGPSRLRLDPESSLAAKLRTAEVTRTNITSPLMKTTGVVAASLRPIGDDPYGQWQFNDPEVLEMFLDWRGAQIDIAFADEQLERLQSLSDARVSARRKVVERLERLVAAGTDTQADLETARAELLEQEIEGAKDLHEAETERRRARQAEAVVVRRLQLVGLDPSMLLEATKEVDVVVADVAEESIDRVFVGQQCEARFIGQPKSLFTGQVRRIAPVLSLERRSLRVLFFVDDPNDRLRPGMFADIGIGTESREALLVPATAIVHVGREDYVIAKLSDEVDTWRVVPVDVGDTSNGRVEILSGLEGNETVITEGAILLKPVALESLRWSERRSVDEAPQAETPQDTPAEGPSP